LATRLLSVSLSTTVAGEYPLSYVRDHIILAGERTFTSTTPTPIQLRYNFCLSLMLSNGHLMSGLMHFNSIGNNVQLSSDATSIRGIYAGNDITSLGFCKSDLCILLLISSIIDVHVVQYASTAKSVYRCNAGDLSINGDISPSNELIANTYVSSISSLKVWYANGTRVLSNPMRRPLQFKLPIPQSSTYVNTLASQSCGNSPIVQCSFYDTNHNVWSDNGCRTISTVTNTLVGGSIVTCSCDRVSTVAVIARDTGTCTIRYLHTASRNHFIPLKTDHKCLYDIVAEQDTWSIYAALYSLVAVLSFFQISRLVW
jgi:hypothetical protein